MITNILLTLLLILTTILAIVLILLPVPKLPTLPPPPKIRDRHTFNDDMNEWLSNDEKLIES